MIGRLLALIVIVLLGVFARRRYMLDASALTKITLEIFFPPFIFLSIVDASFTAGDIVHPAAACAVVILGSLGVVAAAGRFLGRSLLPFAVPVAFMNSGFLALPMAEVLGGTPWVARALIYDQAMNLILFSVGLTVLGAAGGGRRNLREFFLNPVLLSIAAGFAWRTTGLELPATLRAVIDLPGRAAIPIALFSTGTALAGRRLGRLRGILLAVAARYLLGFLFAGAYIALAGVTGETARVILLSSTMPAAVLSFLLAERYAVEPDFAAGAVFLSTILYPLVLPLVLLVMRTCL